ncbi:MAG: hypothetical protein ACPGXY_04180 [Alphaproteobacteria bacterium]
MKAIKLTVIAVVAVFITFATIGGLNISIFTKVHSQGISIKYENSEELLENSIEIGKQYTNMLESMNFMSKFLGHLATKFFVWPSEKLIFRGIFVWPSEENQKLLFSLYEHTKLSFNLAGDTDAPDLIMKLEELAALDPLLKESIYREFAANFNFTSKDLVDKLIPYLANHKNPSTRNRLTILSMKATTIDQFKQLLQADVRDPDMYLVSILIAPIQESEKLELIEIFYERFLDEFSHELLKKQKYYLDLENDQNPELWGDIYNKVKERLETTKP